MRISAAKKKALRMILSIITLTPKTFLNRTVPVVLDLNCANSFSRKITRYLKEKHRN